MTTQDDIRRRTQIAAIDTRLNTLIFGIPLAAVAGMAAYGMAGGLGIGAVALLAINQVRKTHQGIEADRLLIAKNDRATLMKYTPKAERDKLREVYAAAVEQPAPAVEEPTTPPQSPAQWQPATFSRDDILAAGTGVIVLGDSGSGKSTLCRYLAEGLQDGPILVLDPHFDPDRNPWGEGVTIIKEKPQILAAMAALLEGMDKDKRPLTVIADEIPSMRLFAKGEKSGTVDDFILRYGSESRKFNKLAILGSQAGNVKALGLDGMGDFLMNFTQICLGKVAVKRLHNSTARDAFQWAQTVAYPLLVDDHLTAPHPNLGSYPRRDKDNKPMGLGAIAPPPLYPDVLAAVLCDTPATPPNPHHTGHPTDHTSHHITSHCPQCDSPDSVSNGTAPNGDRRRRCKSCGKTWAIAAAPTSADPLVWGV